MGFFILNRFGDPEELVFNPEKVVEMVQEAFTDVKVLPGDQLALAAEKAANSGMADHVVQTLRRNQEAYGPAFAFEIPQGSKKPILGRARRYDVTFIFEEPLPPEWGKRLLAFLQELGPGKLEISVETGAEKTKT